MTKKLLVSILALAGILAVGSGLTYALFTSNTVSITSNSLTTGSAEMKLCNARGDHTWKNALTPALTLGNLVPGGPELELTDGAQVYLGNDSGALNGAPIAACDAYGVGETPGSSDVNLSIIPKITTPVCDVAALADQLQLDFVIDGVHSTFYSLNAWAGTPGTVGNAILPGNTATIQVFAKLDAAATDQSKKCTFNATFTGQQS